MINKFRFVFLAFIIPLTLSAQRIGSSAYSSFGIGQAFTSKTVAQSSMGGIGVAFASFRYLNLTNPAANADLRFATYGVAGLLNQLTMKTNFGEQSGSNVSLQYLALGFPISKKAGFSIGLQPVSFVGYSLLNSEKKSDGTLIKTADYKGSGGANRIYAGLGIHIAKGLSLGIEGSYIFGNVNNSILSRSVGVTLATKNVASFTVRGKNIKMGLQYKRVLPNKLTLHAGATTKFGNDLRLSGSESFYSLSVTGVGQEIPVEVLSNTTIATILKNPLQNTLGMGLGKTNKWYVGMEYQMRSALSSSIGSSNGNTFYKYANASRFSLGGFYLPRINSISSYWKRVIYRAGLRFEKTGLLIDGTKTGNNFRPINDFGISFGLSLPLGNRFSTVNFAVEYGQKGTTTDGLIQENYFNFRLGLSLSDIWFKKRKID